MKKFIKTLKLGGHIVDLYVLTDYEGGKWAFPSFGSLKHNEIIIGIDQQYWDDCLAVLLHETFEFVADELLLRYRTTNNYCPRASDTVSFSMDHNQFSELCARSASFLQDAVPLVNDAWKKHHEAKKKKSKK